MAQLDMITTPTASIVAHLQRQGYYALTTFETTHNVNTREIRLYTNGTVTVLLHIFRDYNCDLYLPATGSITPMRECPQCHYPTTLFCDNPACPQDKAGKQLDDIRQCEAAWAARKEYELRHSVNHGVGSRDTRQ